MNDVKKTSITIVDSNVGKLINNIDVPDGVDTVDFHALVLESGVKSELLSIDFKNLEKEFGNVKELIINPAFLDINIPNKIFPNVQTVKYVLDDGRVSESSDILTYYDFPFNMLLNTFRKSPEYVIDLKNVEWITDYSFDGCLSTNVINTDDVQECSERAFDGSAFEQLSKIQDVVMVGSVLAFVNTDADILEIPRGVTCVRENMFNGDDIKKLIVHDLDILRKIQPVKSIDTLVFPDLSKDDFTQYKTMHNLRARNYIIPEENDEFESIDGVIYSKDRKTLFAFPSERSGHFSIPDGVTTIESFAFLDSKIQSVTFPDSVVNIGEGAFMYSSLESVVIGKNMTSLNPFTRKVPSMGVFENCVNLKHVEIPSSIKIIGARTFYCSGLESITFHEGLQRINIAAFAGCPLQKVFLPESVISIDSHNFPFAKEIHMKNLLAGGNRWMLTRNDSTDYITAFYIGGKKIFLSDRFCRKHVIMIYLNMNNIEKIMEHQLEFCTSFDMKQQIALSMYKDNPEDPKYKQYLKRTSFKIALGLLDSNQDEDLIWFLSQDLMSLASLKKLLSAAEESGKTVQSAYILDAINDNYKTSSFKL